MEIRIRSELPEGYPENSPGVAKNAGFSFVGVLFRCFLLILVLDDDLETVLSRSGLFLKEVFIYRTICLVEAS